jgi:hypothetical protein
LTAPASRHAGRRALTQVNGAGKRPDCVVSLPVALSIETIVQVPHALASSPTRLPPSGVIVIDLTVAPANQPANRSWIACDPFAIGAPGIHSTASGA